MPYPTMVMVVPVAGKPACPGCNVSSFTGATFVMGTGWASDITPMSFTGSLQPRWGLEPLIPAGLVSFVMSGLNDTPLNLIGTPASERQWAAVRIVRASISEPVQKETTSPVKGLVRSIVTALGY